MIYLNYLNTTLGSCFIIILIAVDYFRKYNTDNFQRKLLIALLSSIFIAAIFDYLGLTLEGIPGEKTNIALKYIWSIYMIARNCCYYYSAAFIDYFSHGNSARTKKLFKIVSVFLVIYSISLIPNLHFGYYFYISRDNVYIPGMLYLTQVLMSYFPIIIILIDVSLAPKYIKRDQILLTMFFVIIIAIGAAIDIVLRTTNLIWSCIIAAILYFYFFIIRSDSQIDSLTGIGNRNHFYEYINKLIYVEHPSKQILKKDFVFMKIYLDSLKEINNSFGHLEGDNAIREVCAIIKSCIRHTDFAARYSGNEFILITSAESDIQRVIDRIIEVINLRNENQLKKYKLDVSYSYDVYKTNSGWHIQDFLILMDNKKIKSNML